MFSRCVDTYPAPVGSLGGEERVYTKIAVFVHAHPMAVNTGESQFDFVKFLTAA